VDVLRGAQRVLECRHIAWQVEVDRERLTKRGHEIQDLFGILRRSFTHFIDLNRLAEGPRLRSASELEDALDYVLQPGAGGTDVLFFSLSGPHSGALVDRSP
jgi:hypothetical protein